MQSRITTVLLGCILCIAEGLADNQLLDLPVTNSTRFGNLEMDWGNPEIVDTPGGDPDLLIYRSQEVTLQDGEVLRLIGKIGVPADIAIGNIKVKLDPNSEAWLNWDGLDAGGDGLPASDLLGPCSLILQRIEAGKSTSSPEFSLLVNGWFFQDHSDDVGFIQYAIFDTNATNVTVQTTETGEIIIPSNLQGEVNLVLERSTDMVTWVEVPTGSYSPQANDLFFRVRATHTPPETE